mmetsp:Transcript_4633/g.8299  ORF Transcript_4633/g.8299 Transcript_4633/m.8299 type:complete len:166 (-) Transcript_4633:265-762(-)
MSSNHKKGAYTEVSLVLAKQQWEWLEDMATKHKLPSISKAMRCCINCVALEIDDANAKQQHHQPSEKGCCQSSTNNMHEDVDVTKLVGLSREQVIWMESKQNDAVSVVRHCMEMEEFDVFGIIRCKTSIAKCEGAHDAVRNISEKYGKEEVEVKENIDITKDCGC